MRLLKSDKADKPEIDNMKKSNYPGGPGGSGGGKPSGNNNNMNNPGKGGPNMLHVLIVVFLIATLVQLFTVDRSLKSANIIAYSDFSTLVDEGYVSEVTVSDLQATVYIKEDVDTNAVLDIVYDELTDDQRNLLNEIKPTEFTVALLSESSLDDLAERVRENGGKFSKHIDATSSSPIMVIIYNYILPMVIIYLVYYFLIRTMMKRMGGGSSGGGGGMGGIFSAGKSKAKEYNMEKTTGVSFDDVAGQDEAKESLMEMVDFLNNPVKYQQIGAKQPKGALLVGPPGTGKTLLAKAVAGEAGVPFYSISGSEFVEMFVGVGASRVRDLFEQAKKNAPCIIFIDEIDAIGKSRDNQLGSNDEREQTLNQLLAEMDGFGSDKGIVVLAATNRPEILDKALQRPGRFDRQIIVERPDLPGREAILKVHAKKVKLASDVDLHDIALMTSGATGADLANMINEGALQAVRAGRNTVSQKDIQEAVEVVIAGKEKKDRVMNKKEREMVSYHEVGHALVSALQKNSQPVQKITIVPRTMGSLGYTMNMPEEERYLMTKDEIIAQINTLLGGRAAELVKFGQVTTGASNDIERATKLARSMVTQYGMSEGFGPMQLESTQSKYLDGRNVAICSPESEKEIDDEVKRILAECQQNAINLLQTNLVSLEKLSQHLLDKENITGEEFMQILREDKEI